MLSLSSYSNDINTAYLKSNCKCFVVCSCIDQYTAISCVAINSTSVSNQCIDDSEYSSIDPPVILSVQLGDFVTGEWFVGSESIYYSTFEKMGFIHPN